MVKKLIFILMVFSFFAFSAINKTDKKIKILLVGDSTTIGSTPRDINPEGPHLEQMIEQLAAVEGLPELEVINAGKGGETAKRLLGSKHYQEKIEHIADVDYIFLRMGINDWFKCKDFKSEFPSQMKALIAQLHTDHPKAVVYLCTITQFMKAEECETVNKSIYKIAKDEKLEVLDIFTPYHNYLVENGPYSLNVRQCYLSAIPEKYHEWLKPYTHYRKGWGNKPDGNVIKVNNMLLDPIFGKTVKSWYFDHHPNSTGYNLIANETVRFLSNVLK